MNRTLATTSKTRSNRDGVLSRTRKPIRCRWRVPAAAAAAVLAATLGPRPAAGAIMGFGDFSEFTVNQGDGGPAPTVSGGAIRLAGGTSGQSRSLFANVAQPVGQFTATYTYRAAGTASGQSFGATFLVQNATAGRNAVAAPVVSGIGTSFGYSDFYGTFSRGVASSMEYGTRSAGSSSSAVYRNGSVPGGSTLTAPLNLYSGNPINATVTYNGTTLTQRFVDSVTGQSFEQSSLVDIPSVLGGPNGYVGFTAASGPGTFDQYFSNFTYTNAVPEPGSSGVAVCAGAAGLLRRRRRRRPGPSA